MIDEPQTLVWLPTSHRLAMSETGMYVYDYMGQINSGAFPLWAHTVSKLRALWGGVPKINTEI